MSVHISGPSWHLKIPPVKKLVLLSLADQANDDGLCWPSLKHIQKRTGLSERAIHYAIQWLQESGILRIVERKGRSNEYWLTVDNFVDKYPSKIYRGAPNAPTPEPHAPPPLHDMHPESSILNS